MEKTLQVHLAELREQIAQEIEAAHDGSSPMAKCYDIGCLDVVCSHEEDAAIARGYNRSQYELSQSNKKAVFDALGLPYLG